MTHNDIEPIRLPEELVTITPIPDGLTFAYQRSPGGVDLIAVVVDDKNVGTVRVLLTVGTARVAAATVAAMVNDLDALRDEWRLSGLD
jgi:hypothetical protein